MDADVGALNDEDDLREDEDEGLGADVAMGVKVEVQRSEARRNRLR